jgi:hypothetical protein
LGVSLIHWWNRGKLNVAENDKYGPEGPTRPCDF